MVLILQMIPPAHDPPVKSVKCAKPPVKTTADRDPIKSRNRLSKPSPSGTYYYRMRERPPLKAQKSMPPWLVAGPDRGWSQYGFYSEENDRYAHI